jgi:hypothetical protein
MNVCYTQEEKDCWEHLYLLGFSSARIADIRGVRKPSVAKYIRLSRLSRTLSEAQKGREPWNKGKVGAQTPWNKGKKGVQVSNRKGTKQPKRGPRKPEHIEKIKEGWRIKLEAGWDGFGGYGQKPNAEQRLLPGTLYLVRYLDESETHFKLGITRRTLQERLGDKLIAIIQTWNFPLGKCFDLEQATLRYAAEHGHRYSSPTTTELIRPEGILPILEFIEHSLDDDGYLAQS